MLKGKQVVAVILSVVASAVFGGNSKQSKLDAAAAYAALRDANAQVARSAVLNGDRTTAQQGADQAYPEHPLPTLLQLRDCALRDAILARQQKLLDAEEAALRAEEARRAARKPAIEASHDNRDTENLTQAEGEWNHASAQLKKKLANFDHLSAPYGIGVLYQVQHCAFSQVRRQDLRQLCQEGAYPQFCAKYQAFQTDE